MLVSREKKAENIAEYILYMWHIEDSIRALNLEMEKVEQHLISKYDVDDETLDQVREWYKKIVSEMKAKNLHQKGHIDEVNEILNELAFLHNSLLNIMHDFEYKSLFEKAGDAIQSLEAKSMKKGANPVETALTGIYGVLMLKMGGKGVGEETKESVTTLTEMVNHLGAKYKDMRQGTVGV